ncbi:MAG: DUF6940 family protein [Calditrichia bacterium]
MIEYHSTQIQAGITHYLALQDGEEVSYSRWIAGLRDSEDFTKSFIEVLQNSPFKGYFWEVRPITRSRLDEPFEFVLVEGNMLTKLTTDTTAFREYFEDGSSVKAFANLGADAQLIVPAQLGNIASYAHLAAFVRNAPESQVVEFWQQVATEYDKFIGDQVKWLSTAGLGIYWLHVRIDSRPKYYCYDPYKAVRQ